MTVYRLRTLFRLVGSEIDNALRSVLSCAAASGIAFSPVFFAPAAPSCKPDIFISHGTRDSVLPISICSRKIVPRLDHDGYDVTYLEFNGGHMIPPGIALQAVKWLMQ